MNLPRLVAASAVLFSMALPALGQAPAPVRLGELDDRPVVGTGGAKIADVYDVVVDTEEGRAAYIVFSVGMKVVPVTLPDLDLDWRVAGACERLGRDAIHDAEVVVAPALAVDRSGNRLGQGGGSYDRALARRHPDALIVVLLHDGELLPVGAVPTDPHDVAVHVAVMPSDGTVALPSA